MCVLVWRFWFGAPGPPFPWTTQNFALFFPSPAPIFALFVSLWGSYRGILVVFEGRDPKMCTFGLFGCCKAHIGGPRRSKHHQNSTRRPPREREKRMKMVAGDGKKSEILGSPPFGHTPFSTLEAHTIGAPTSLDSPPPHNSTHKKTLNNQFQKKQTINSQKPKSLHTTEIRIVGLAKVGFDHQKARGKPDKKVKVFCVRKLRCTIEWGNLLSAVTPVTSATDSLKKHTHQATQNGYWLRVGRWQSLVFSRVEIWWIDGW